MSGKMNVAIFFSINYPFHYADSYVDDEVSLWAKKFDKVLIVSLNKDGSPSRPIPANAHAIRFSPQVSSLHYLRSLFLLFSGLFWKEMTFIVEDKSQRFGLGKLKSVFKYFARALAYQDFLKHQIKESGEANITVYSYFMLESMFAACLLKDRYQLLLLTRLHGYDLYFERGEYGYLPFRSFMVEKIDRLFFVSSNGMEYFKKKIAASDKSFSHKLEISRLGIASHGKPNVTYAAMNPLVLVSTSWILENKRIDLIARALLFLPNDCFVKWIHFGGQQKIDVEYANEFLALANEIQSSRKNIQIDLRGNTPKEEIFNFLRNNYVHFFINVSASEGIPISMMEASSFGIPLLGTLVGGVGEIIKDGQNGFHLHSNLTPNYLSHQLLRLIELSEQEYIQLRKNSFDFWRNNFSADINYAQFSDTLISMHREKFGN
jgi:colanic acid/amylovoran biosynthesis glycosyltransferase